LAERLQPERDALVIVVVDVIMNAGVGPHRAQASACAVPTWPADCAERALEVGYPDEQTPINGLFGCGEGI